MASRITNSDQDQPNWIRALNAHDETSTQEVYAVVAEYETPDELIAACEKVRDAGFRKWDSLTPFPVHGIDEAMGIKQTILPWIVLGAGLTGGSIALLLQWFTNTYDYPFIISGKPMFSLPANIPVTFELTVLFSAFTAFGVMLALNLLPAFYHPLFRHPRIARYSSDRFAIVIEGADPLFEREKVEKLLKSAGALATEVVFRPERRAALPVVVHGVGIVATFAALIPFGFIAKARFTKSEEPRIHIIQDMDMQPKFKAQAPNRLLEKLWGDPRASLAPLDGTIARGSFVADEKLHFGQNEDLTWVAQFPLEVDENLLERGQQRFGIYCSVCHGLAGDGNGSVAKRAVELARFGGKGMAWAPPANFTDPRIVAQPVGEIFNTITNGKNNMKGYAAQISVEDRWAITAYVRAIQKSQTASVESLPAERRAELEAQ
jgi:mono/diheme cytochrome c family protein